MKKLNTLAFSFRWINKLLDELEKNEIIDVVEEYYTDRENSKDWSDFIYLNQNQPFCNKYSVPYPLYETMFRKYFDKFSLIWTKFDCHFGNISPVMNTVYMFKQVLNYCYNVFLEKKVELVMALPVPHRIRDYMFVSLAEELGIKVIVTRSMPYLQKNLLLLRERAEDFGEFENRRKCNDIENYGIEDVLKARQYMAKVAPYRSTTTVCIERAFAEENLYKNVNKKRYKEFNKILKEITVDEIPNGIKYVYCPLHYQPEAATLGHSETWFEDQSIMIEYLTHQLPKNMYIVVKEHFYQTYDCREPIFYQRLAELKKVIFVSPKLNSTDILKNAECAITTNGSVGFEALLMNKPVVYSGNPLYKNIPGAFRFDEHFDINNVLNYKCNPEEIKNAFNKLCQTAYIGMSEVPAYTLDCSEEENIKRLTFAYTDYINELLNNDPEYITRLHNKYAELEKQKNHSEHVIPEEEKEYLPDVEYFYNMEYEDVPKYIYLNGKCFDKLKRGYKMSRKEQYKHWHTQLVNFVTYLPVSDEKVQKQVKSLIDKLIKTKLTNKYKIIDTIAGLNPEWLFVFKNNEILKYKVRKVLHVM